MATHKNVKMFVNKNFLSNIGRKIEKIQKNAPTGTTNYQ